MLSITLPPELEHALSEQARAQGTTPELLALDSLRERFTNTAVSEPAQTNQTMAEYWADFIGCLHSSDFVPGGAQMSTDSGRKFAQGMVSKREQGKL